MKLFLLSDLHFGKARPELVPPLLNCISENAPDLVVIAGDFVQRARASQFSEARAFLDRLQFPWVAVPGNHDIPLFNIFTRLFAPRSIYRRWIAENTEPLRVTDTAVIAGIDTTYRLHHQTGYVRTVQIERIAELIERYSHSRTVIVVAHHPFHQAEDIEKKLMKGAPFALQRWADAGRHVILSGHLHRWTVEPFVTRKNQSMTLQVHCGTGLSTRLRGEPNECAVIDVAADQIRIQRHMVPEGEKSFAASGTHSFIPSDTGWERVSGPVI